MHNFAEDVKSLGRKTKKLDGGATYADELRTTTFLAIDAPADVKQLCRRHHVSEMLRFGVINFVPLDCDSGP